MSVLSEVTVPNLANLVHLQESHVHLVLFQYRVIAMYTFYFKSFRSCIICASQHIFGLSYKVFIRDKVL